MGELQEEKKIMGEKSKEKKETHFLNGPD